MKLLLTPGKPCLNPKVHYLLKYFSNNYKTVKCSENQIESVLNKNNNSNTLIVFYTESNENNKFKRRLCDILSNNCNFLFTFVYFSFDYWYLKNPMFCAKNHKIVSFADSNKLSFFRGGDYSQYAHNIIPYNLWCCYNSSFREFNLFPQLKLAVSGEIHKKIYPERFTLKHINSEHIAHIIYDRTVSSNYSTKLNQYFAGFSSCVHIGSLKHRCKFFNTHTLLQKTFEILAVGALLVMPQTEKQILEDIGLVHDTNCYLIDMKNVLLSLKHIFNNVEKYNKVRKAGHEFAKLNFKEDRKIQEIRDLIE
jgi:hypothetical protein